MYLVAILLGIYSYFLFALGLLGQLHKSTIVLLTVVFIIGSIFYVISKKHHRRSISYRTIFTKNRLVSVLFGLVFVQGIVNLIGALGPELAFDALWYHLTFPKLYLQEQSIQFIPGSLFYYSAMPKLTEMLYTASLALHSDILAKVLHFLFGVGSCVVLYQLGRRYFSQLIALLMVVIFYSNLVVGWESITAYVDLARTFFEVLALLAFLQWTEEHDQNYLALTGVMVGLAVSTKLLALGSVFIFSVLILYVLFRKKKPISYILRSLGIFLGLSVCIPLPWFVFSFIHSGNPVYPFFTSLYDTSVSPLLILPTTFIIEMWNILTNASDPLTPIYVITLPLIIIFYKRLPYSVKLVALYSFLAMIVWYITPRTGGGRFILPYLPAFSFVVGALLYEVSKEKIVSKFPLFQYLVGMCIIISMLSIGFRGFANAKYLQVIFGFESKTSFLSRELNFAYGDFYDTDGYFRQTLKPNDRVLLVGFHNLYYVDFPFIHESVVKKGDRFTHIAVQNGVVPERFWYWPEMYYNPVTKVGVYSLKGQEWVY